MRVFRSMIFILNSNPTKLNRLTFINPMYTVLQNDAPTGVAHSSQNQSVAAFVAGDQVAFYHCSFYSTHNTLFDYRGRHYYGNCYIQGSVDFIFGRGRSIFHVSINNLSRQPNKLHHDSSNSVFSFSYNPNKLCFFLHLFILSHIIIFCFVSHKFIYFALHHCIILFHFSQIYSH